jgi:L-rhamnose mutarotase
MPGQRRRTGTLARLKKAKLSENRQLHAEPWPEIVVLLKQANISNYSISLNEPSLQIFASSPYCGENFETEMTALDASPVSKKWYALTSACQIVDGRGQIWSHMSEAFHMK